MKKKTTWLAFFALFLFGASAWAAPHEALIAYFVSALFWLQFSFGSWILLMIHNLTGGRWGQVLEPTLEVQTRAMPLAFLFFIPILLFSRQIFPWALTSSNLHPFYLNPTAFALRALVFFATWIFLSRRLLSLLSLEKTADVKAKLKKLSAFSLIYYSYTATLAAVDWILSIESAWHSSAIGMIFLTGQILGALSLALLLTRSKDALEIDHANKTQRPVLRDCGNILMSLVLVYAYLNFMQFLITWSGNLPDEVPWYLHRQGAWKPLSYIVVVFEFLIPFPLLLGRWSKESKLILGLTTILLLIGRFTDELWLMAPSFFDKMSPLFVLALLSSAALLGLSWRKACHARV